jgi:hypothetical protein
MELLLKYDSRQALTESQSDAEEPANKLIHFAITSVRAD